MSHPNKAKGTRYERECADFLALTIPGADRVALHGGLDHGDVHAGAWALQCRNLKQLDLAGAVEDAKKQAVNAKKPFYAAILKRRGKGVTRSYAVMELEQLRAVIWGLR
jgi:hypothetical protein